jgi:hypothetical protein
VPLDDLIRLGEKDLTDPTLKDGLRGSEFWDGRCMVGERHHFTLFAMVESLITGDKTDNLGTNIPRDCPDMEVIKMFLHARSVDTGVADETDKNPAGGMPGNVISERHGLELGRDKERCGERSGERSDSRGVTWMGTVLPYW